MLVAGNGGPPVADALAPSRHEPGRHGDLLSCRECGTVHQPALPAGPELHDLYRDMSDDAYLDEEAGRRATAARLLDLIAAPRPRRAAARRRLRPRAAARRGARRGYEVMGLELSRTAAGHAREALGLDVRERRVEAFDEREGFDVVVLADVLEHLEDPVDAMERCAACCAGRGAVPGHARSVVADRAPGRAALVGLRTRAHLPGAARHPARAARRARAVRRHRRAARALVLGAALGRGPGGAPRARRAPLERLAGRCPSARR